VCAAALAIRILQTRLDRLGHTAMLLAFDDMRPGLERQLGGQRMSSNARSMAV